MNWVDSTFQKGAPRFTPYRTVVSGLQHSSKACLASSFLVINSPADAAVGEKRAVNVSAYGKTDAADFVRCRYWNLNYVRINIVPITNAFLHS